MANQEIASYFGYEGEGFATVVRDDNDNPIHITFPNGTIETRVYQEDTTIRVEGVRPEYKVIRHFISETGNYLGRVID